MVKKEGPQLTQIDRGQVAWFRKRNLELIGVALGRKMEPYRIVGLGDGITSNSVY